MELLRPFPLAQRGLSSLENLNLGSSKPEGGAKRQGGEAAEEEEDEEGEVGGESFLIWALPRIST